MIGPVGSALIEVCSAPSPAILADVSYVIADEFDVSAAIARVVSVLRLVIVAYDPAADTVPL